MAYTYTDKDRVDIAWKQYSDYSVGEIIKINDNQYTIGTVREVFADSTGLEGYVIEEPDGNVTVLFQGSKGPGEAGAAEDWLENDFPMAANIISSTPEVTPQLQSASRKLNQIVDTYPNAQITVYGHSLGSMDAQYAMANLSETNIKRIESAHIYNGPNDMRRLRLEMGQTYNLFEKIFNYVIL